MGRGLLISATDTGAGKTYTTCLLGKRLQSEGIDVRPLKPVESGCEAGPAGQKLPADAIALQHAFAPGLAMAEICLYPLWLPLSPHLAARREDVFVDVELIKKKAREAATRSGLLLLEGAGGITVEIQEGYDFSTLARELDYPVLIVVENRLGCLNHLKLTLSYLKNEGVSFSGVILNDRTPEPFAAREYNEEEIRTIAAEGYLGRIPCGAAELPDDLFARFRGRLESCRTGV